jgi:hypothetical protein
MRPIIFVKYYDKGSTEFGGHQISEALRSRGYHSETLYARDLARVRDSILVFIKTSKIHHLIAARKRNNLLVLDVMDTVCFKRRIKSRYLYHGLLFRSTTQRRDFSSARALNEVILQQGDPRYRPNQAGAALRIGYFGTERSMTLWKQIPGVEFFEDDWFTNALRFNCHLSIRLPHREILYKPATKVATAAACNAVLITTRDRGAVELLGDDYPYYTDPDRDSVLEAIDHARATFGSDVWVDTLRLMSRIREETTLDRSIERYLDFFRRLENVSAARAIVN